MLLITGNHEDNGYLATHVKVQSGPFQVHPKRGDFSIKLDLKVSHL